MRLARVSWQSLHHLAPSPIPPLLAFTLERDLLQHGLGRVVDLQGGGVGGEGFIHATGAFEGEGQVHAGVGVAGQQLAGPLELSGGLEELGLL
jgi:hypothetical protein